MRPSEAEAQAEGWVGNADEIGRPDRLRAVPAAVLEAGAARGLKACEPLVAGVFRLTPYRIQSSANVYAPTR
jgi:hypothetical protein